jgi:voltage-dependent calcium channel
VPVANFDNIFSSMLTFFEIATLENWVDTLWRVIDSTDEDQGPIRDNRPYMALLFVAFIFITTFFVMNLFISVIVDKFNEEIRKREGSHNFSEEQKEWVKMQRIMVHVNLKIKPVVPTQSKFRTFIFSLV